MTAMTCSLDGTLLAVLREGELALYNVEPFEPAGRITIPGPVAAPAVPAFIGNRLLLVHGVVGERTHLTLLALPRLTLVSQLELEAATRFLAVSHQYALLDRGDDAFVATCTPTAAAVAPLRMPMKVAHAIGLEQPQFLTWSSRGPEIWDAASRRPAARVALELPRGTTDIGVTGQNSQVWAATSGPDLIVSRLSDGRTFAVPLPNPPERVTAHPMSSWLVLDVGGRPHAVNVALRSCAPADVPTGLGRALVPVRDADTDAYVFVDEGDRLSRAVLTVDPAMTSGRRGLSLDLQPIDASPAPPPDPSPPPASTLVDAPRPRPAAPAPKPPAAAPTPAPAPAPRAAPASGARPSIAERVASIHRAPAPAADTAPAPSPPRRATVSTDWRDALCAWARSVTTASPAEPLPSGRSPLLVLAERGDLSAAALRILHLLYAEWLAGHGDTGVAARTLAEVGGASDGWSEALATGRLGALGLVRSELGRTRLVPAVGDFLDGRAATGFERVGVRDPGEIAEGVFRVATAPDDRGARGTAARAAAALGQLAFVDDRTRLDAARLEAWLRQIPIVMPHDLADLSPFDLRPRETVVAIAHPDTAGDDGPPFLELTA